MNRHPENPGQLARELTGSGLSSGILSSPRKEGLFDRVRFRLVRVKGRTAWQLEQYRGQKVFHRNLEITELEPILELWLAGDYARGEFTVGDGICQTLANRRGELTAIRPVKTASVPGTGPLPEAESHNRNKNYIFEEGVPVPFLVDLGVMTPDGTVTRPKYDKFRQINRFIEFIEDVLPDLLRAVRDPVTGESREISVIDFGCGKSYLTFAVYHYLAILRKLPVRIVGLDLKDDVIAHCSELARSYGYDRLSFAVGDIAGYTGTDSADLVITLHACDTATDLALARAVSWNAKAILSVPCCQHELNAQLGTEPQTERKASDGRRILEPAFRYGIIRERMAALLTDALRAELLESRGYRVQILEFIDMSHTPKNLLIRAVRPEREQGTADGRGTEPDSEAGTPGYRMLRDFLGVSPTLERELAGKKPGRTDGGPVKGE
jgi:hypothetical protein